MMNLSQPKYDDLELKAQHQAHLKAIEAYEQVMALKAGKFFVFQVLR